MSEALIFASTNPQYDDRLLIELQAQTWGEHVVYRNFFWHWEQFLYTLCFAKRRASDKDAPVFDMNVLLWFFSSSKCFLVHFALDFLSHLKIPPNSCLYTNFIVLMSKVILKIFSSQTRKTENIWHKYHTLILLAPVFPCPLCVGFFFTLAAMKNHLEAEHRKYQCDICRKLMSHKRNVDRHR